VDQSGPGLVHPLAAVVRFRFPSSGRAPDPLICFK
jgi:hypothetical protein